MTNANHVGDRNKLVVGDNDHGDSKPTLPMYSSVLADNAALREDLKASLEAHDEMRLKIVRLTKERDKARKMYCEVDNCTADEAMLLAKEQGWDCYEKEETP